MAARRAALAVVAAAVLLLASIPGPVVADTPYLVLTMVASPNPSGNGDVNLTPDAPGQNMVTLTGTITPVGGSFANVHLQMTTGYPPLECTPTPICNRFEMTNAVTWIFPTIESKTTVTAYTEAMTESTLHFDITGCTPNDCLVQNTTLVIQGPTMGVNLTYNPGGVILPGSMLHFTVTGSTNLPPLRDIDIHTQLPAGLGDPINLSGGLWSPAPARYIDYLANLNPTSSYTFDAQVTAAVGTDLKVVLTLMGWTGLTKTVTLHVGPVSTPAPHPTSGPTAQPPQGGTPSPTISGSVEPIESQMPSVTEPIFTSAAPSVTESSIEASSRPSASIRPDPAVSDEGRISLGALGLAAGVGGAGVAVWGGAIFVRRRRRIP